MGDLQTRPLGDEIFSTSSAVTGSHKVLRNTYMLLSMTLLFSAGMAGLPWQSTRLIWVGFR